MSLTKFKKFKGRKVSTIAFLCFALVAVGFSLLLYRQTQIILESWLKQRLISIVTTAELTINSKDVTEVIKTQDSKSDAYIRLVHMLGAIRNVNENVRYAYILEPTSDEKIFKFVADADSIDPNAKIDLNGDGKIDDNDALVSPGEEYDASDAPALNLQAKNHPTTDDEIAPDQWGTFLAAYAPIQAEGKTIAILGIDVEVSQYLKLIRNTFAPFLVFTFVLILILLSLTLLLTNIWESTVSLYKQLDRQKDELISIVSHQLATPITSLKWNVEMLLDGDTGPLSEEQKRELQVMQSSTNNLADLVSMMLDVSRIELGKMKVDRADVDIKKLFEETIEMVRPKALEKKQTLEVVLGDMPVARLDKRLTRMTLENLLTNAVKYTPESGKVTVTASVTKNVLHYQVRDTGFGIPKKEQSQIFGKLYRASNVQTVPGNGLGLFAAKGAVVAQCGRIRFESSPGWGTVFTVDLPLTEEASLPATPKKKGCLSWRTRAR